MRLISGTLGRVVLVALGALASSGCMIADRAMADAMAAQALARSLPTMPAPVIADRAEFDADERVSVTVNGQPVPVRVGPARSSTLHIRTADAAMLFGARASNFDGRGNWPGALRSAERIGPVTVRGHRAPALLAMPLGNLTAPVEWFEREAAGLDAGQAGPYVIPATIVHFRLGPPQPGERSFTLPLDPENNGWGIASTSIMSGPHQLRFAFAPHFPRSVASAAAGGALARAHGGRFMGMPEPVPISHGIARPARPVRLDRALMIGPVRLIDVLVRTLDYGTAAGIADQVETADNPADILVTGRTDRQRPNYIVYLGADVLGSCSSISFDKAAMTITLSCLAQR